VTNPNDILDAYDELVRLVDILGADDLRTLVDRACGQPAPLHIVGEQGPEPVDSLRFAVNRNLDDRTIGEVEVLEVGTPPVNDGDTPADGCPWCTANVRPRLLWRHVNTAHRDDLEQLYVEDGIKGLQDTFGVPYGTAWNWARKLDGEAA